VAFECEVDALVFLGLAVGRCAVSRVVAGGTCGEHVGQPQKWSPFAWDPYSRKYAGHRFQDVRV